jgi:hypothetical protein
MQDGWKITITYEDGHAVEDFAAGIDVVSQVLGKHVGSEHGDIARIEMV